MRERVTYRDTTHLKTVPNVIITKKGVAGRYRRCSYRIKSSETSLKGKDPEFLKIN